MAEGGVYNFNGKSFDLILNTNTQYGLARLLIL
jgi:hypothetical protein